MNNVEKKAAREVIIRRREHMRDRWSTTSTLNINLQMIAINKKENIFKFK